MRNSGLGRPPRLSNQCGLCVVGKLEEVSPQFMSPDRLTFSFCAVLSLELHTACPPLKPELQLSSMWRHLEMSHTFAKGILQLQPLVAKWAGC